jgi:hypothetical protein
VVARRKPFPWSEPARYPVWFLETDVEEVIPKGVRWPARKAPKREADDAGVQ